MGTSLNSSIVIGVLAIVAAISLLYNLWIRRPEIWQGKMKERKFKGWIALTVVCAIFIVVGFCLLISGIVYAALNS